MSELVPQITDSGLTAVLRADGSGLDAIISHIALGDSGYTPTRAHTGLDHEVARAAVAGGAVVGDHQIHVTALVQGEESYWVREVGFVLEGGEMLAIWSDPDTPLAYKVAGQDLLLAFDLVLDALPASSVNISVTGENLNLTLASELTQMATAFVCAAHRELSTFDALFRHGIIRS